MLPDSRIPELLGLQIPGLSYPMQQLPARERISKVIHTFADYTSNMIRAEQLQEVKRCFTVAGVLYKNGSGALRNAIESVFMYALSPLLCSKHKQLLPSSLQTIRIQHLQTIAI
ncbi:MAG TPA: hypothetical protein VM802_15695 [Chitinophaga sp.]|uniref:DUF7674 family protein n=1 Tax=Chitinophaga sp. TaxID=1869181 RepID=UPI002BE5DE7E|nr:hypothetical protein [Chitinophaga sp.]HVI46319.1 hypothetical protein [Chitinophaga sp.]